MTIQIGDIEIQDPDEDGPWTQARLKVDWPLLDAEGCRKLASELMEAAEILDRLGKL